MQELTNLISNVGFPIIACLMMFKMNTELQKTITDLTSTLKGIDVRLSNLEDSKENKKIGD